MIKWILTTFTQLQLPNYLVVAASSWGSRVVTTVLSLLTVRILLDTLGVEHYAAYAIAMALVGWFTLADFGTGQSLQNFISESRTAGRNYTDYITSTAVTTFVVILSVIVIFALVGQGMAESLLRQFKFLTPNEKYAAFISTASIVMLSAWGSIVYRIWYAEHKGYLANVATTVASIVAFICIYTISRIDIENKFLLCLISTNLPLAILPAIALATRLWNSPKTFTDYRKTTIQILTRGSRFCAFNVIAACVFQIDVLILSQFAPPDQIVVYSIGLKLFTVAGFLYSALLQAFWPVCAEALATGNWSVMQDFKNKFLIWGGFGIVAFTFSLVFWKSQIGWLFSSQGLISIDARFLMLMGILYLIRLWTDFFAIVLQSVNDMNVLMMGAVGQAIVGAMLQFALVPRFGIHGTAIALCLSWVLTVSWILPLRVKHIQKRHSETFT